MLAALKNFFGAMWNGGIPDDSGGAHIASPLFDDHTSAEFGYGAGSSVSEFGEGFGAMELRAAEANYDHRLQNTRDATAAQKAVENGNTQLAAAIMTRNSEVGIQIGDRALMGADAAAFVQQQTLTSASEAVSTRDGYDQTRSRKDALNRQLDANVSSTSNFSGGMINVSVGANDTQWDVVVRSLRAFAAAGLPEDEQRRFVADWSDKLQRAGETTLYHYDAVSGRRPLNDAEFAATKQTHIFGSELTADKQPQIIADLQRRVRDIYGEATVRIETGIKAGNEDVYAMSAGGRVTEAESYVRRTTDFIDRAAGGSETDAGISAQFNRLGVGGIHLLGEASAVDAAIQNKINDAARKVLPESFGDKITQTQADTREWIDALRNAQSELTAHDDALRQQVRDAGITVPLIERIHQDTPEIPADSIEGAIYGDYSERNTIGTVIGQTGAGIIPVVGQAGDARDITAAGQAVYHGERGSWLRLGVTAAAVVPGFDWLKGGKIFKETLKEGVEETAEAAAKRLAREAEITEQIERLVAEGHGPQRHGAQITEQQLEDRATKGFDPVTGTIDDAFKRNADGTPMTHRFGKDATKITSYEAYVEAETYIRNSKKFSDAVAKADATGEGTIVIKEVHLEEIFGANYKDHVFGQTRLGSVNTLIGVVDTDLTDGTMRAVYIKDATGNWKLETMFPETK